MFASLCNACDHLISPRHPFHVKSLPLLMTPLSWYHMLCKSTNHNTHTSSHLISPRHPFHVKTLSLLMTLLCCYVIMLCKRCSTNHNTDAHTHTHTQRYENRQPFLRRDVITSVWWTFDLIPTRLKQWQAWWCSTKRRQILYMKQRGRNIFAFRPGNDVIFDFYLVYYEPPKENHHYLRVVPTPPEVKEFL